MPEMVAPRALVFRPLVKGNEALGTRLGHDWLIIITTEIKEARKCFFVSFPPKRNGIVFSSGVNYLHRGGNIQSEFVSC